MKGKWLFASLLLTAALTMTSCSFKLPVDLPFKIPFITADRNTKQNDEDPSDPEKATDPIITDEPEVPENIDTTENTPSGNDHESNTCGDCGGTTKERYLEILEFTHFVEFFSFNKIGENHKEKILVQRVTVVVALDLGTGNTKNLEYENE